MEKIGVDAVIADKPEITPSYLRMHSGGSFWKVFFILFCFGSIGYGAYYVFKKSDNREKLLEKFSQLKKPSTFAPTTTVVIEGSEADYQALSASLEE